MHRPLKRRPPQRCNICIQIPCLRECGISIIMHDEPGHTGRAGASTGSSWIGIRRVPGMVHVCRVWRHSWSMAMVHACRVWRHPWSMTMVQSPQALMYCKSVWRPFCATYNQITGVAHDLSQTLWRWLVFFKFVGQWA